MALDRYRHLFERAPLCFHEIDAEGRLTAMNPAGLDLVNVQSEDDIRGRQYLDFVAPDDRDRIRDLMADALAGETHDFEFVGSGQSPQPRHFASCFVPCVDAQGRVDRLIGITRDITEVRHAEAELRRLSRAHAVLSRCNRSLAQAIEEQGLLDAFCANLVEVGHYPFAWIGYAESGVGLRIRRMAHAGREHAAFSAVVVASANGCGRPSACRLAIERAEPVVVRSIADQPDLTPWADAALGYGCRSMIALPLKAQGAPFGNFSIFSDTPGAFDAAEVALLAELAEDLASGITTVRARAEAARGVRRLREEAERDTRRRIAATLHDGVGQSMQAVILGLKRLHAMVGTGAALSVELLDQLVRDAGHTVGELRALSHELRPPCLEHLNLVDAVRYHCSEVSQRSDVEIRVLAEEVSPDLTDSLKEQCFLAFREALSNALRHASPSGIDVVLKVRPEGWLNLAVIDNGSGFALRRSLTRPAGLGLSMIQERAESLLGTARVRSTPGKGTLVRIRVPLTQRPS